MKNVSILIVLILFSGCVTQKRCLKKFPPETIIERHDSIVIHDTTIYKDVVIYDTIPGDTQYVEKIIPIKENVVILPVERENAYARAKAWVEDTKLKLELIQKEQEIQRIIKDANKETKYWRYKYTTESIKNTQVVYQARNIHKAALWFSAIVILLFVLFIVNKFTKWLPL